MSAALAAGAGAPRGGLTPPGGFEAVTALLQTYFDGLHHSDTVRLRQVFHPSALYATAGTEGQLTALAMDAYIPLVDARPSPASRGEARADRILRIEFAGPATALAVVQCAIGPKHFTDLLNLLWLDGRWQIIAKVFQVALVEAPTRPASGAT